MRLWHGGQRVDEVAAHYQTAVMGRFLQSCQQAPRIIFTALYYSSSVRGVFLLEALHVDRIESLLSVRDVFYLLEALFMVLKADCPLQVCFCWKSCWSYSVKVDCPLEVCFCCKGCWSYSVKADCPLEVCFCCKRCWSYWKLIVRYKCVFAGKALGYIESWLSVRRAFLLEALLIVLKTDCPLQVCFCWKRC